MAALPSISHAFISKSHQFQKEYSINRGVTPLFLKIVALFIISRYLNDSLICVGSSLIQPISIFCAGFGTNPSSNKAKSCGLISSRTFQLNYSTSICIGWIGNPLKELFLLFLPFILFAINS